MIELFWDSSEIMYAKANTRKRECTRFVLWNKLSARWNLGQELSFLVSSLDLPFHLSGLAGLPDALEGTVLPQGRAVCSTGRWRWSAHVFYLESSALRASWYGVRVPLCYCLVSSAVFMISLVLTRSNFLDYMILHHLFHKNVFHK